VRYIIAVSGGIDSVVLLDLMSRTEKDLVVAHFDHGIREDSASDARFVEALSDRYKIQFVCRREKLGADASEELARQRRYEFLRGVATDFDGVIVTAHHRSWHRKDIEKREKTLVQLTRSFWQIIIIFYVAAIVANKLFLFDLSPLFASAGIIGVALGFGAQSLVKDFLSGIFIIAENQYRVGDVVDVMGAAGTVERVGTRTTVIRDSEGNVHYVPNGTIQHVINKTMGYSMSRFSIYIDPSSDISAVTDIINATGQELAKEKAWQKKIIDPPKFVSVGDITGRGTELIIAGKTQPSDQWSVTSEMRHRLLQNFDREGVLLATLPTPTSITRR
jgi:moderate conductance mechanosensitive channel